MFHYILVLVRVIIVVRYTHTHTQVFKRGRRSCIRPRSPAYPVSCLFNDNGAKYADGRRFVSINCIRFYIRALEWKPSRHARSISRIPLLLENGIHLPHCSILNYVYRKNCRGERKKKKIIESRVRWPFVIGSLEMKLREFQCVP